MDHVGPQGVLQEINGSLEISKSHEVSLEVLWVLRGFLMNLKGFSGASRSHLETFMNPLEPQGVSQDVNGFFRSLRSPVRPLGHLWVLKSVPRIHKGFSGGLKNS